MVHNRQRRQRQRFLRLAVEPLEDRSLLATIVVTSLNDNLTPGNGLTLREAIQAANTNQSIDGSAQGEVAPVVDTIVFQPGLTGSVNLILGQLQVTERVVIQGLGADQSRIHAQGNSRVFDITSAAGVVTIDGLTLTGGAATSENGGAIRSASNQLNVQNSTITGNTVSSGQRGAGIWGSSGTVTVTNSTISGNTILGTSGRGGGIYAGNATLTNVTISGNVVGGSASGGGVYTVNGVSVMNSTVTGNTSGFGGGLYTHFGTMTVRNSIVAGNTDTNIGFPDIGRYDVLDAKFSLIGDNNGTNLTAAPVGSPDANGNIVGTHTAPIDPRLGSLQNNGGPTKTHALLAGNPAINAGSNALVPFDTIDHNGNAMFDDPIPFDQRGTPFQRIAGNTVDMGAFEYRPSFVPPSLVVDTAVDEDDGIYTAGDLALREAVVLANFESNLNVITFAPAMAGQPILLTMGQMTITETLTMQGLGAEQTSINGQNSSRLFDIKSAAGDVTFDGLKLTSGKTTATNERGGAIRSASAGRLTIQNTTLSGNTTTGLGSRGGGIYAIGPVTVANSTISGNSGGASGGSIFANGPVTITNSTISGNSASGAGGGIFSFASVTASNSTISGNSSLGSDENGGGIWAANSVTVINSTVTGNVAEPAHGGGLFSLYGPITIRNSIVAGNLDVADGSHPDLMVENNGVLAVEYSLIGDNNGTGLTPAPVGSPDASGNLIGSHAAPINPRLGPLQNNVGPTNTHALIAGSPAINAGDPNFAPPPTNDQRGVARVSEGRIDMGAFESFPIPSDLVVDFATDENDGNINTGHFSFREAIALANASSGPNTIKFPAALAGLPILLSLGQIAITDPLTIQGLGASQTTINGQNNSRLFDVTSAAGAVTFDGLKLIGGKTTADGEKGGAVRSTSTGQLTIQNSVVSGNSTTGTGSHGGGIFASGPVTIKNSTISGNSTTAGGAHGGAIRTDGSVAIINSTISGNSTVGAYSYGGGVITVSTLTITGSSVSGNSTGGQRAVGGGLFASGELTIVDSTISGNSTGASNADGGGIFAYGSVLVSDSTITGNSVAGNSADGGGMYSFQGPVTVRNSIVAGNLDTQDGSHPDLRPAGTLSVASSLIGTKVGTSLVESNPGPDPTTGNKIGGPNTGVLNPRLAPLANNGGTTQTHALCTGFGAPQASCTGASPALNAGSNALIPADAFDLDGDGNTTEPVPFDQRGSPFSRIADTTVDIGSFEFAVINHAPTCTIGPAQNTDDEKGLQTVPSWIVNCSANDPGQTLIMVSILVDKPELFSSPPAIDANGTLTYDPKPNGHGRAMVTITIQDNGGTAGGGVDQTTIQVAFDVAKPHRLFNAAETGARRGLDVTGSTTVAPDGFVVAQDVLAVINYINAKGSGPIPPNGPYGPPYCDVTGDNQVVAEDVLKIINWINANPGQSEAESGSASNPPATDSSFDGLLLLIADDVAAHSKRNRKA